MKQCIETEYRRKYPDR